MNENKIGIIILAAGSSSRLGQPKQLLQFEGKTLIGRAVESALKSNCSPVIAVLGANFQEVKNEIKEPECQIVLNPRWQTGISSSIKTGIKKMLEISPQIAAVIISLTDQPLINSSHFDKLRGTFFETKKPIIASVYHETIGVPALFANEMFPALLNLEGDHGAKQIIHNHPELVEKFLLSVAAFDIDTLEDLERLKKL